MERFVNNQWPRVDSHEVLELRLSSDMQCVTPCMPMRNVSAVWYIGETTPVFGKRAPKAFVQVNRQQDAVANLMRVLQIKAPVPAVHGQSCWWSVGSHLEKSTVWLNVTQIATVQPATARTTRIGFIDGWSIEVALQQSTVMRRLQEIKVLMWHHAGCEVLKPIPWPTAMVFQLSPSQRSRWRQLNLICELGQVAKLTNDDELREYLAVVAQSIHDAPIKFKPNTVYADWYLR
ncbi:competence protein ComK [Weissella soli]|uniref:competence protein ComK n=2 Tax=Weissella soli TaxID=155866 RepID=UPI0011BB10F2|nr:hypothetical protein [Weissella soli]QEA35008.1 hypothetical protein FGL88_04205 [Weissella soli]